jgi:hypothetical protein
MASHALPVGKRKASVNRATEKEILQLAEEWHKSASRTLK